MKKLHFLLPSCILMILMACSSDDNNNSGLDSDTNELNINQENISFTTVSLKWESVVSTESNTVVVYDIFLEGNKIKENNNDTDYTLTQLNNNTTYEGKIVARSIIKSSNNTSKPGELKTIPFSVTTKPYTNPSAPVPSDFSINTDNTTSTSIVLAWNAATISDNSSITYDLYLDGDLLKSEHTETEYTLSSLEKNTTYSGVIIAQSTNEKSKTIDFTFKTLETDEINVSEIKVTPEILTLATGEATQLTANILPENATNKNVTWVSSDTNIATVDADGNVTAVTEGEVSITATAVDNDQISGIAVITIQASVIEVSEIKVTPETLTLAIGGATQLTANVLPENATNKNVTWISSDTNIATVDADGNVTAVTEGEVSITATAAENDQISGIAVITIQASVVEVSEVKVTPETVTLAIGEATQLTANVLPENATNKNVIWSSSDTNIATVDADGNVSAVTEGTISITATSEENDQISSLSTITVETSIIEVTHVAVTPNTLSIAVGDSKLLETIITPSNATNKNVIWTSSNTNIATVDADGNVTAVNEGIVSITATSEENNQLTDASEVTIVAQAVPVTSIEITPITLNDIFAGQDSSLNAKILPENATNKEITWTSSDPNIATVFNNGYIRSILPGTVTFTATSLENNQINESRTLTVLPDPISFDPVTGLYEAPPGSIVTFGGDVFIGGPLDSGISLEIFAFTESNLNGDLLLSEISSYTVYTPDLGPNEEDVYQIYAQSFTMPANGQVYLSVRWDELDPQNPFTSIFALLLIHNDQGPTIEHNLYPGNFIQN